MSNCDSQRMAVLLYRSSPAFHRTGTKWRAVARSYFLLVC